MTNPFAPPATTPPAQPYAQPQQPAAPAQPGNPFGPAAQPQAAPVAQPMQQQAPQSYGPPGQQGSSQWPQGAAPAPLGQFGRPQAPTIGGGQGADLVAMYGRLVLVLPQKLEHGLPSKFTDPATGQPRTQDRMTATFIVLDGANPIAFGGNPYSMPPVAHTKSEPLPHVSKALWISQSKLIEQCQEHLPAPGQTQGGMVLGRLVRAGNEANSAWILQDATPQDEEIANYYLAGVASGQFAHPLA
jgi:hypothetical protein